MDRLVVVLAIAIIVGGGASAATSHPMTNVVLDDNSDGWFTTSNLEGYGNDLDRRIGPEDSGYIFSGHPAYVMESDEARLLFDMPRAHYFAISWNDSEPGNEMFANFTTAIESGHAQWAINNSMTDTMLEKNATLRAAYNEHYCRVDDPETVKLYARTDSTLYRWVPSASACPEDRRPNSSWERPDV